MREILKEFGQLSSASHSSRNYRLFKGELFPEILFGQSDADTEWGEDKDLSSKLFVHTESYEAFIQRNNLFIFGRRGTGKTALIKMLDYEINKGLLNTYNYSKIITQEDTFYRLTLILRTFSQTFDYENAEFEFNQSRAEIINIVKEKLVWVIYATAMIAVIGKHPERAATNKYINTIREYLVNQEFIAAEDNYLITPPIVHAVRTFSNTLEAIGNDKSKVSLALLKVVEALESTEYKKALASLKAFLTERKEFCVILIDSQELYEFDDKLFEYATSGLMDAVLKVFNHSHNYRVLAKAAFPSEIVPHLKPANQGKINDKRHFIFWKYGDILKLISKRYCQLLNEIGLHVECEELDKSNAEKFIYKYIPKETESYSKIKFDSIAYIINHTQKKPREVIQLFNVILTLAKQNGIKFTELTSECIREGTNARIEDLSSGVMDMYKKIYPKAEEIIKKTFNNSENIMTYGAMHRKLNDAKSVLANSSMNERYTVERLFSETGVIGILENVSKISDSNKRICEANFEYQIKGVLTMRGDNLLVIHPMFYQELNVQIYSDVLVYPKPTEEERNMEKNWLAI
ncbi:MAG TPA: hypothetical protein VK400_16360 [Pyrinomonadaceae bacterium]|nr:hypothetical protein [Pyrinomonadaceae bacterium]